MTTASRRFGFRSDSARNPFAPIEVPTEIDLRHGKTQIAFSTHLPVPTSPVRNAAKTQRGVG